MKSEIERLPKEGAGFKKCWQLPSTHMGDACKWGVMSIARSGKGRKFVCTVTVGSFFNQTLHHGSGDGIEHAHQRAGEGPRPADSLRFPAQAGAEAQHHYAG